MAKNDPTPALPVKPVAPRLSFADAVSRSIPGSIVTDATVSVSYADASTMESSIGDHVETIRALAEPRVITSACTADDARRPLGAHTLLVCLS